MTEGEQEGSDPSGWEVTQAQSAERTAGREGICTHPQSACEQRSTRESRSRFRSPV